MTTDTRRTVGIFLHSIFPIPGWCQRDMGFVGWKGFIDWARCVGFNSCALMLFPQRRLEDPAWTLPERRRLYHSLLSEAPPFGAGDIFFDQDPLMRTAETVARDALRRQTVTYAAEIGLRPRVGLMTTLGAPTFCSHNPHLVSAQSHDFTQEGIALSPADSGAVEHLLDLWGSVVERYSNASGFILWSSDPGGFDATQFRKNPEAFIHLTRRFHEMIRRKRPDAEIVFPSWGLETDEVATIARKLPNDLIITEPPLIHSQARSPDEFLRRIEAWQERGFPVETWLEIQENPTILLPAAYPERIEKTMRLAEQLGVRGHWACSSFYTFVFTLNFHVVAQLANYPGKRAQEVVREFLSRTMGVEAIGDALEFIGALEDTWSALFAPSQHQSGFTWPWHMVFAASLFPESLMQRPIQPRVKDDIDRAVSSSQQALAALDRMSGRTWMFRPLETSILITSTRLLHLRARFRQAKLPVLENIRTGDLHAAIRSFATLEELAAEMVMTAASAPNTVFLNTHWCKLELLPKRLAVVRQHLPELTQNKAIRGLNAV